MSKKERNEKKRKRKKVPVNLAGWCKRRLQQRCHKGNRVIRGPGLSHRPRRQWGLVRSTESLSEAEMLPQMFLSVDLAPRGSELRLQFETHSLSERARQAAFLQFEWFRAQLQFLHKPSWFLPSSSLAPKALPRHTAPGQCAAVSQIACRLCP